MPETQDDIELLRELAAEKIDRALFEHAEAIANEQIRLALHAKREADRIKAGQGLIEQIKGQPTQRIEQRSASLKIVSHMSVPGLTAQKAVDAVASSPALLDGQPEQKTRAILKYRPLPTSAPVRARYQKSVETDPKNRKELVDVPESPGASTHSTTPNPKLS